MFLEDPRGQTRTWSPGCISCVTAAWRPVGTEAPDGGLGDLQNSPWKLRTPEGRPLGQGMMLRGGV